MLFLFTPSLSLVCEEKKPLFGGHIRSHNATSSNNKGSLNFIIPDEVLQKNSSFKRSEIELGNHFKNNDGNCERCNSLFFSNERPPTLFVEEEYKKHFKHICQLYENKLRFASVFDMDFRIPFYSAYQIKTNGIYMKGSVSKIWKYEPQLESDTIKEMRRIGKTNLKYQSKVKNQATDEEYEDSGWDKGHLFPNSYNVSMLVLNYLE